MGTPNTFEIDSEARPPTALARTRMSEVIDRVERSVESGDFELATRLIEQDLIVIWYGLTPDRFRQLLSTLLEHGSVGDGLIARMAGFMGGADPSRMDAGPRTESVDPRIELFAIAGRLFELRLQGKPVEALQHAQFLQQWAGTLRPVFDVSGGWAIFAAVQHGITAMLAGEFNEALVSFTQAQANVVDPALAFLTRDAHLRKGIVEALYGDLQRAQNELTQAKRIVRTESWAEGLLDASEELLAALLMTADPEESLQRLNSIPPHQIGEMWPFHALATHRALMALGREQEARNFLEMQMALPLPLKEGTGFSGSVLPLCASMSALASGDLARAREQFERADPDLAVTSIVGAVGQVIAGRPKEALQILVGVHTDLQNLRTLNLWRLSVMASAHLLLGEPDHCRETLGFLQELPGGIRAEDLRWIPPAVRSFAAEQVEGWQEADHVSSLGAYDQITTVSALTAREIDVLRALATGRTREEIAREQFISLNTLKAHLSSLYRKLGVKSRVAAVLEAERRGFV